LTIFGNPSHLARDLPTVIKKGLKKRQKGQRQVRQGIIKQTKEEK